MRERMFDIEVDGGLHGWVSTWPDRRDQGLIDLVRSGSKVVLIKLIDCTRYSVTLDAKSRLYFIREQA